MVERPIKKSDRQAVTESNTVVEEAVEAEPSTVEGSTESITQSSEERIPKKLPLPVKDNTKGKGRGSQQKDEQSSKAPGNPALMRGPKPTKSKPPIIQKAQEATESDSIAQTDQEET